MKKSHQEKHQEEVKGDSLTHLHDELRVKLQEDKPWTRQEKADILKQLRNYAQRITKGDKRIQELTDIKKIHEQLLDAWAMRSRQLQ